MDADDYYHEKQRREAEDRESYLESFAPYNRD